MKDSNPRLVGLAVAIAAAICVVWLWRSDDWGATRARPTRPPEIAAGPPPGAPARPAPVAAPHTEMRTLLAALDAMLRRGEARAREALLTFKDDAALQRFLRRAEGSGLAVLEQLPGLRTVRVRHRNFNALQEELLGHADDYEAISANSLVSIPTVPARDDRAAVDNVPFGNRTLDYLAATRRNESYADWGKGVTIAILDTGVTGDATFGSGRLSALDIGLGIAPGNGMAAGHGTSVASLAAGLAPDAGGVAPAANLLSIRVTDENGTSDLFTLSRAILAAVDAGAKIINISLGGYSTAPVLGAALDYATSRGAVVVAAAGNDQAAQLAWPAADPRVISVGASDAAEQQVSFSNSGQQLQLAAPGYGVQAAWLEGQRVYVDGTSASAPLASGAIAAVLSQHPLLTPAQAAQILLQTASDAGSPGTDPAFGHGILNLDWAMNYNRGGYVDTAVASHFFDAANNQMQFVVQNRSAQAITGMSLNVTVGSNGSTYSIPSLLPGETYIARVPVNDTALRTAGTLSFATQLVNPPGVTDAVPANNQKTSALDAPEGP